MILIHGWYKAEIIETAHLPRTQSTKLIQAKNGLLMLAPPNVKYSIMTARWGSGECRQTQPPGGTKLAYNKISFNFSYSFNTIKIKS